MAKRAGALQKSERGVRNTEHPPELPRSIDPETLGWSDLRLFLTVADLGSFRAAAAASRKAINTYRSAFQRLEDAVGEELGLRSLEGIKLTAAGRELHEIATHMRLAGGLSARDARQRRADTEKTVRIAVSEGLGTFWLIPRMVSFQAGNREITVDITCDMRPGDVLLRNTDVAVSLDRPTEPDLVVGKLGNMHLMLFASQTYLAEFGQLVSLDDWRDHKFVEQVAPNVPHTMLDLFVPADRPAGFIALRANTSSAHYWAVAQGAGIGLLPTYIRAISRKVQPLEAPLRLRRDIWFSYHADARRSPEVRKALAWLKESFDPVKYPWFQDDFLHPDEFSKRVDSGKIVQLFEGFVDP
jgi:DNA-binding transcriptional LysR family regulator